MIVSVAVFSPLRREFHYISRLPEPTIGCRVLVPFGRQQLVGVITAIDVTPDVAPAKLKTIIEHIDSSAIFSPAIYKLINWCADYYQHSLGDTFATALPKLLRQGKPCQAPTISHWIINDQKSDIELKNAPKQKLALQLLQQQPLTTAELKQHGVSTAAIKSLQQKDMISEQHTAITSTMKSHIEHLSLNEQQQQATTAIIQSLNQFNTFLLEGITGSGKTEVYLQAIAAVLEKKQSALIIIPEIGLTPQFIERLQNRFGDVCALLHSGLNDTERLHAWLYAQSGDKPIVVGTRSSIFVPIKHLNLIIVDEEHDTSLKQQEGLRYSARDLAVVRAKLENIPLVLGTATPSLETLHNALTHKYQHLRLQQRAGNAKKPVLQLIDLRCQQTNHGLSEKLINAIKETLAQDQQVLLFLNRRGFSPVLMCHDCGWHAKCSHCDANMTYHKKSQQLRCHHCDYSEAVPKHCPDCRQATIAPVGLGTEQLEQTLALLFPSYPVVRIDRDSTTRKNSLQNKLAQINNSGAQILIGTQMLAKGHHFPKVTLVGVINADSGFFSSDFRALERTGQLLLQVAGRAGRAEHPGKVMIQTLQPDNQQLSILLKQGYHEFALKLLEERKLAMLPPYSYFALIRAESTNSKTPFQFLEKISKQAVHNEQTLIMGPIAAPMPKRANRFRAQLLLHSQQRGLLQSQLQKIIEIINRQKSVTGLRYSIDVDPIDTF